MSVLRDAKELGYGLDHFMITGENFPVEWEDSHQEYNETFHDDIVILKIEPTPEHIPEYIPEHAREYVQEYDSNNDYIYNSIDVHYHNNSGTEKTIDAAGKVITNKMLNITKYIKNIDINEARRQGITIRSIRLKAPLERGNILETNIENWDRYERAQLDSISSSERVSETERNERKIRGRASHLVFEKIFSNFAIKKKSRYAEPGHYIMFSELASHQHAKYKKHKRYNPQGTPTMMQIAFGLIRKYGEIEIEIRGYIPGINAPHL